MKNKRFRRVLSIALSVAMLCTMVIQGVGVAAASYYETPTENLVVDPGFDLPNGFVTDNAVGRWNNWDIFQSTTDGRNGGSCVKLTRTSSLQQSFDPADLQVGTTYMFTVWVKVVSGAPMIGAQNWGGSEVKNTNLFGNEWTQYSIEFTYTGGAAKNPLIYVYMEGAGEVYVDDASLVAKSDIQSASIENGSITVYGDNLNMSAFSAVYSTNLTLESKTLELTSGWDTLFFTPIPALPVPQNVTVTLSYGSERITLRYTIDADESIELVPVDISSVNAENGIVTINLAEVPTIEPTAKDFTFTMTVDGAKTAFVTRSFTYDGGYTIIVEFDPVSASLSGSKNVTITAASGDSEGSASFTVDQGTSRSYYVSSSAGAGGDGSQGAPFNSIAQLNTITFQPGDHIYFKSGETFTGMFMPQGSGQEGAPIVVSSYGGTERPIIQAVKGETVSKMLGADGQADQVGYPADTNPYKEVGGTILLENVAYWEIRGLELIGVTYDPDDYYVNNLTTYNVMDAGIRVINDNQGDLAHFVFDDLVIHGFRGRGTNFGKTCGGIQFNVIDSGAYIPSCFVDVSITNCHIYECGRSGINSLSVWGYRYYTSTGAAWPSFPSGEYTSTYSYYPHRNFYMANCTIHDIDGDGLIVDTWSNSVVENNTVYRCAIHVGRMAAAVGLFNWNSDNTVFQYNECYSNGTNATLHSHQTGTVTVGRITQDGQGIEVDALNQNTWVQYNYLHDNAAFMMLCTEVNTYTSFNTWIRYNVTENDGCNLTNTSSGMGWFLNGACGYNTEVYNNTCILGSNALNNSGLLYLLKYNSNQYKFYNNIFYYTGDNPVSVASWQNNTDWKNNLFINISGVPSGYGTSLNSADGLFVGGEGPDAYQLADASYDNAGASLVSMADGMFSDVDFAGAPLSGAPGIGAFQSAN